MDRRNFFRSMIGGVAAAAAVRTWPFRVYSFPTEIQIDENFPESYTARLASVEALELENVREQLPYIMGVSYQQGLTTWRNLNRFSRSQDHRIEHPLS